jgi:uncharacterized protein (TIGR02186 family)
MRAAISLAGLLLAIVPGQASAAQATAAPVPREEVQSDLSTREISIQSNFTGIEILIYGSIDFSQTKAPDQGVYDVIIVIRAPSRPLIARHKVRVAGIWVNTPGKVFPSVPGFYAALSTRPVRAVTFDETLKMLGIGLANVQFGRDSAGDPEEETYRSAVIRLKERQKLFQEDDDGVTFIGRSLFRATVSLPVNVPIGRYTADVYLFRDGQLISKNQSTLAVNKAGFEHMVYWLAFHRPLI